MLAGSSAGTWVANSRIRVMNRSDGGPPSRTSSTLLPVTSSGYWHRSRTNPRIVSRRWSARLSSRRTHSVASAARGQHNHHGEAGIDRGLDLAGEQLGVIYGGVVPDRDARFGQSHGQIV